MKRQTLLAQAGLNTNNENTDITPPINLSVTFQDSDNNKSDFFYSVFDNQNRQQLEATLVMFEKGHEAISFSSGSAAIASVFSVCKPNDHIIVPHDVFQGTARLLNDNFKQWGLEFSFVDMTDLSNIEKEITPNTKIIWIESPSNPMMRLTKFSDIVKIAKKHNIITICDNTYMPLIQQPLEFGVDAVIYSTTKYISGHNDTVGGVYISKEQNEINNKIRKVQQNFGAIPSPFESWLTIRGMKTLPLRIRTQSNNAIEIVNFLTDHPKVEKVNYPTLSPIFKEIKIEGQLHEHYGGMISFELNQQLVSTQEFLKKLKVFKRATSLGGTISPIEDRSASPIQNIGSGTGMRLPCALIRISVGIEDVSDLIEDLTQALQ